MLSRTTATTHICLDPSLRTTHLATRVRRRSSRLWSRRPCWCSSLEIRSLVVSQQEELQIEHLFEYGDSYRLCLCTFPPGDMTPTTSAESKLPCSQEALEFSAKIETRGSCFLRYCRNLTNRVVRRIGFSGSDVYSVKECPE